MTQRTPEQRQLLEQVAKIAEGLGQTLAPFCEVVVHDLLDPSHAVLAIHNNLSGREVGQGATELGLARSAAERGIFLAPGAVFFPQRQGQQQPLQAMRVNVAYANDARFLRFLQAALKAAG